MIIQRRDITNTLPVGILEDGEFTPDDAGLAVHMRGFYTVDELKAIIQDLIHVDDQYKINKAIKQTISKTLTKEIA
jgi:hypothetical protein